MQLITMKLKDIRPYPNNPRKNDTAVEAVAESIRQCGYVAPIIVDENGVILAGHTRYKALKALGRSKAEVVVKEGLTEEQKKKYRLLDNKTNELATWDFELLAQELEELDFGALNLEWNVKLDNEAVDVAEDNYNEPLPTLSKIKVGDVYKLGKHRLICGDCNDEAIREVLIGDAKIELVYTDPPYDMDMGGGGCFQESMANTKKEIENIIHFDPYTLRWLWELSCGSYYIWTSKNGVPKYFDIFKDAVGFSILSWVKTNPVPFAHNSFLPDTEYCLYFRKKGAVWNNGLKPTEIYRRSYISKKETRLEDGGDDHPTIKPLKMVADKIQISSSKGGGVLDPFGGSGTTLIACEQLNRKCYMSEIEPRYCEVIIKRWEKLTGERALPLAVR